MSCVHSCVLLQVATLASDSESHLTCLKPITIQTSCYLPTHSLFFFLWHTLSCTLLHSQEARLSDSILHSGWTTTLYCYTLKLSRRHLAIISAHDHLSLSQQHVSAYICMYTEWGGANCPKSENPFWRLRSFQNGFARTRSDADASTHKKGARRHADASDEANADQ